ncbi:MAG: ATP-binding protein, partial [Burkholderiaceae bacterium]
MRSIRRHLLVWILGALSVGATVLLAVSYMVALAEMNELLDNNLQQVALSVASHEQATSGSDDGEAKGSGPPSSALNFAILTWKDDGQLVFSSDPRLALPFDTIEGASRVLSGGEVWEVFTVRQGNIVVKAAQLIAVREFEAVEVAAKLLPLMILLIVLIGLLLVAALRRGLKPLLRTAEYVGERTALSLEPIELDSVPQELHVIVHAINRLMQRLSETFMGQRRFVADAAHELRTPVTALKLQLQLLERAQGEDERALAMVELKAGVDRSERLIAQLLALSRLEPGAWKHETCAVDVAEVVRRVVGRLSIKADQKRIDLGAEVVDQVIMQADAEQLVVLLENLVENALRHTPTDGIVSVVLTRTANANVLSVIDNGPGIDAAERDRVFDRFYRSPGAPAAGPPVSLD